MVVYPKEDLCENYQLTKSGNWIIYILNKEYWIMNILTKDYGIINVLNMDIKLIIGDKEIIVY
ncbi:MAG: hypothetical protein CIT02_03735 [Methanobacterium sp. BAmetb5]|nr:MAG: hypothetical protein CIT02_03735 [Methanobacterium sp. BAmetb5]